MSYGPFSAGHVVATSEWNEFVQALDDETTRATAAEAAIAGDITTLDSRLDTDETKLGILVPGFGGNTIRTYGRESLTYVTNSPGLVEFEPNGFGEPWQIARFAEPNAEEIWIALTPTAPAGARIVQVSWWVQGAAWATMPSVPAYVDLIQRNVITGATTSVISFSDAAANVGELNSARQITTNVVSHTISSACQYYLKLVGPTGGTGVGRSLTARGAYIAMVAP